MNRRERERESETVRSKRGKCDASSTEARVRSSFQGLDGPATFDVSPGTWYSVCTVMSGLSYVAFSLVPIVSSPFFPHLPQNTST